MPLQIPIQPVSSQQISCVLDGQNCLISVYQKGGNVFFDLNSNGTDMCIASLALNEVPLDPCNSYDGFSGNLFFIDIQGSDDPQYTGFGTRWFLVYLSAAELAATAFVPSVPEVALTLMTLAASLEVTSSAPGPLSVAHGLGTVPFLIEIIPASTGAIWAQSIFADDENIYLEASDAAVAATVLVFTSAPSGLIVQAPAATLLASSTAPGPFSIDHGLGEIPEMIEILPTSAGAIWAPTPPDNTKVYLEASDEGVTVTVSVYAPVTGAFNLNAPAGTRQVTSIAPGNFSIPHNLPGAPSRVEILMISAGAIWAQSPAFDERNVYLEASDAEVIAEILIYA